MATLQKPEFKAPFFLAQIAQQKIDPTQLNHHELRGCIRYLLLQKTHAQHEIATILKTSEANVTRTKQQMLKDNQWILDEMDERAFAVDLIHTAMAASAALFRKGKQREAWQTEKEALEVLQSLGFLKRAPVEIKMGVTLQEILRLAAARQEDEEGLLGRTGVGPQAVLTNGTH